MRETQLFLKAPGEIKRSFCTGVAIITMLLIQRNSRLSMANDFSGKNVSLFFKTFLVIPVTIHVILHLHKECNWVSSEKRTCLDCFKICRSFKCFEHHKKTRRLNGVNLPSKCETSFKCRTCFSTVQRKRQNEHRCGERVCHICNEFVLSDHLCYMQKESPKEPNENLIFYDFETDFSSGEHIVNFAVAQYFDGSEIIFKGYSALNEFCEFLFSMKHKGFTAIAHNAKGFDAILIQRWLIKHRPTSDMYVIHSGQKIMQLTLNDYRIRLIDSLNFLQMPLSKFPVTFGLDPNKFSKGDFPFKFNTFENQNYIGQIPDIEYYSPDIKSEKERTRLIAWHQEVMTNDYVFDFQKEMYKYCSQDVTILRLCLEFCDLFLSETKVDPFCYCTIASSVMSVYRSNYLKESTIGIIPKTCIVIAISHILKVRLNGLNLWQPKQTQKSNIRVTVEKKLNEYGI
ncbi:uncharacterized protein LOC114536480 [Dendronephthya gigantea]|uniref:uncharacterized protein LOC114536480 n=1 Tax=Dendronephthya gigantea TaxID=151771 RepID=UPI00106C500D|nr:uncharacterized protein LOC114536480 [Dendronephthya gigantea]